MIRESRQPDGSIIIWTERRVVLYDRAGRTVESRLLTPDEAADFEAWADLQPGGAARRAMRDRDVAAHGRRPTRGQESVR